MRDIILIGGGGHCKSVIETIKNLKKFNIVGILDLKEKIGSEISGVEIIGTDENLIDFYGKGIKLAFVTVGSIGSVTLRYRLYKEAKDKGYMFPILIDKTANVSKSASIGEGVFIGKGSIINTDTDIGEQSIINTGAIIEHDCQIGSFCHVSPGSTLSGNVKVGNRSHIGSNATLIQNISIGENTMIGAGSVVVKDIKSNVKAYGNPCREVKKL